MSLQIRLESYQNPSKILADRTCCIKETSTCRVDCSNSFKICVSTTSSADSCDISEKTIGNGLIEDDELFTVGGNERRFKNPVVVNLPDKFKQSTVYLSIKIYHKSTSLVGTFDPVAITIDGTKAVWTSLGHLSTNDRRERYRKKMSLSTKTLCNAGYIGQFCEQKSCTPRDDDKGHYTCNAQHEIVCLPGWTDVTSGCTKKIVIPTTSIVSSSLQPLSATTTHITKELSSLTQQHLVVSSTIMQKVSPTSLLVTTSFTSILSTSTVVIQEITAAMPTTQYINQQTSIVSPSSTTINARSSTISKQSTEVPIKPSSTSSPMVTSTLIQNPDMKSATVQLQSSSIISNDFTKISTTILAQLSSTIIDNYSKETSILHLNSSKSVGGKFTLEPSKPFSVSSSIVTISNSSAISSALVTSFHATPSTTLALQISTVSITTTPNPDRPTSRRKTSVTFPLLLGIVLSIALIGWLIILIYLRKRLIAKARIRSIIQMTGAYQAPSPQECKVTVLTTPISNNDEISLDKQSNMVPPHVPSIEINNSVFEETTLNQPLHEK